MKKMRLAFCIISVALLMFAGCSDGGDSNKDNNNTVNDNPADPINGPSNPTDNPDYPIYDPNNPNSQSASYIGSVAPGGELQVGSVIFTDGSSEPLLPVRFTGDRLTSEQKSKAIAVIFYKGSEGDALGAKTLGVGLKTLDETKEEGPVDKYSVLFCTENANAYKENIETILSTATESGLKYTFTGDTDGSDNFSAIKKWLIEHEKTDDTGIIHLEGTISEEANYPVFIYAAKYGTKFAKLTGTNFTDGWYVPTAAEMYQIAENARAVYNSFGECGYEMPNGIFMTSTQHEPTITDGGYSVGDGGHSASVSHNENVLTAKIGFYIEADNLVPTEFHTTTKNYKNGIKACFVRKF